MKEKPYTVRGKTVFTEEQVQRRIQQALIDQKLINQVKESKDKSTPSRHKDNFPHYINKERADLTLGNLTDDQLAVEVYMYGNPYDHERTLRLMNGDTPSIAYMTAAKERIRWLSRHLDAALEREQKLVQLVARSDMSGELLDEETNHDDEEGNS